MASLFRSFILCCMYKERMHFERYVEKHHDNDGSTHLSEESSRILAAKET
jgi:hypothetical protein